MMIVAKIVDVNFRDFAVDCCVIVVIVGLWWLLFCCCCVVVLLLLLPNGNGENS